MFLGLLVFAACKTVVPFQDPAGKKYIAGYAKSISGQVLRYHAPLPVIKDALLVRSIDREQFIVWETEPVPENFTGDTARFIWVCAVDVNKEQHRFDLFVNDKKVLTFKNPADKEMKDRIITGTEGIRLHFRPVMVDKHGDLAGFMVLSVPAGEVEKGKPLRLKIMGESAGSRVWYMTYRYIPAPALDIESQEAVVWQKGEKRNLVRIDLVHLGDPVRVDMQLGDDQEEVTLQPGMNIWRRYVPVVKKKKELCFCLKKDKKLLARQYVHLMPVQEKTIYLLHHSHVDIGYTQVQAEVQRIQWHNLEKALQYAEESSDRPAGDQFKWNVEVMWPLVTWMRQAAPAEKERMVRAIRQGRIELDALFANELTGLCRPEELMQLVAPARRLADSIGVPLKTAMISDIPGYTWGLVPVLAQNGVKYFSIGTNTFDHIGHILPEMGDKPFWWQSPSGQEKVLCWIHGKGYSMFHGALENHNVENALREKQVFDYLKELHEKGYPYDIVALRYNIGSDNGPPDPLLVEAVKRWNEKYCSPRMVISTVGELFSDLERKYGDRLPVLRGDLTPYWSDGAYSSALETEMNRASAERIVQASVMYSMIPSLPYPAKEFNRAWENILLYDEHTWGSWNSISEPDSPFTLSQWQTKRSFALRADRQTKDLLDRPLQMISRLGNSRIITVVNTLSWKRSGIVSLGKITGLNDPCVTDEEGKEMICQVTDGGDLLFRAEDIPPFGWKRFRIVEGSGKTEVSAGSGDDDRWKLENEQVSLTLDPVTGSIVSLRMKASGTELADTLYGQGLNGYVYIAGRKPLHPLLPTGVRFVGHTQGPLYRSVVLGSEAPGTAGLIREVRLWYDGRVEIVNTLDKKKVYTPEAAYFTFPFRLPESRTLMDIAWGAYRPGKDQLPGSCKNYFTVQRWVDVSDAEKGVTWFTPDAGMVELGRITTDANQTGWRKTVQQPGNYLISWVMNNYWGTNYKATQEGSTTFRYYLSPHGVFDRAAAKRQGLEIAQPLLVIRGAPDEKLQNLPVPGGDLIVTFVQPLHGGWLLRVFNPSEKTIPLSLQWKTPGNRNVFVTGPIGVKKHKIPEDLQLPPFGIVTLWVKNQ